MPQKTPPDVPEFRRQMVELVRGGRVEELAEEFEPAAQSIRNWVRQIDARRGPREDGLTTASARSCVGCAGRTGSCGRSGRSWKSRGLVRSGDRIDSAEVFGFVRANQADLRGRDDVPRAGVSPSGYYAWRRSPVVAARPDAMRV